MKTTTADLFASAPHSYSDGDVRAVERQMTSSDSGIWRIATFRVESDADVHAGRWEAHPEAAQAVRCLAGGVRPCFRPDAPGGAEHVVRLREGTAVIVPRGRWRRLELDAPAPRCRPASATAPASKADDAH